MTKKPWDAGHHCWLDLMTTDLGGAKRFYSELFGWSYKELPRPDGSGEYTMATLEGGEVGGVNELMPEQLKMGVPPSWSIYTAVDDVAATTARAKELGGAAVMEPMEIPGTGRMAILSAPGGEVFSIWERGSTHVGASRFENQHGAFFWGELGSHDTRAAASFYTKLFPWTAETKAMGDMEYTTFNVAEQPAAGMYAMPPEMAQVPAHWLAYFVVTDIEAATHRALELGAEQVCPATNAEGMGTFSILSDPQGAHFAIFELDEME